MLIVLLTILSALVPVAARSQQLENTLIFDYYHSGINDRSKFNLNNAIFNLKNSQEISKLNQSLSFRGLTLDYNILAHSRAFRDAKFDLVLRELYWQASLTDHLELAIGKQLFRWGTGFYKNPAAFADAPKRADDISDRLRNQQGRDSILLSLFWGSSDFHVLYLPDYSANKTGLTFHHHEVIFRYYVLLGNMDITALYDYRSGARNRLGLTYAYAVNDFLALQAEWSIQKGSNRLFHRNTRKGQPWRFYETSPYTLTPLNGYLTKFLAGFSYTTAFRLNVIMEYVYDGEALDGSQWRNLTQYSDWLATMSQDPNLAGPASDNLKWVALSLNQQRHYLFYRVSYPISQRMSLEWIGISNLNDGSSVFILVNQLSLFRNLELNLRTNYFAGSTGSDFGSLFRKWEIRGGFNLSF